MGETFTAMISRRLAILIVAGSPMAAAAEAGRMSAWETPPGWTATRGGDEGKAIRVTTLAADGPGSLAAALATEAARKIVFDVAGVIDLKGHSLTVRQPHLTIAGETAPAPGVTLIGAGMNVATHDVIIRHLRIRPGAGARPKRSGWEVDGLSTMGGAHNVIIDHCSFSWATDENLSASGPRFNGRTPDEWRQNTSHRITFSHCIVGEGLHDSAHGKGPHSMGSLIHDNVCDIAIIGNLYISNGARNPLFKGGARGVFVNNVVQNPGGGIAYGLVPEEWAGHEWQPGAMSIVGNLVRKGPSSGNLPFLLLVGPGRCDAYLHDNLFLSVAGRSMPTEVRFREDWNKPTGPTDLAHALNALSEPSAWPARLRARPVAEVLDWVLANCGARPWDRDAIDRRLVAEARAGGGKIINHESEVGGFEVMTAVR